MNFDVHSARTFAQINRIDAWLDAYLNAGYWANPGLAQGLHRQTRFWIGPLELPLDQLVRCCGPEAHMEYRVDPAGWELYVNELHSGLSDPLALPPLIVHYEDGVLSIRDGNHRHEAARRKGWRTMWALIWYDDERAFQRQRAIFEQQATQTEIDS